METFVILRRNGWRTGEELEGAAQKSRQVADDEMPDDIAWIRSYVLAEPDGSLGTVCVYQATDADTVRRHAQAAGLPADEVIAVADTVLVRPDPESAGR